MSIETIKNLMMFMKEHKLSIEDVISYVNDLTSGRQELEAIRSEKEKIQEEITSLLERKTILDAENQDLQNEISNLINTKGNLTSTIESLRGILTNYNEIITGLGKKEETVVWEPIKSNDNFLDVNRTTIENYIERKKMEYKEKTGASDEECEKEFQMYCPMAVLGEIKNNFFKRLSIRDMLNIDEELLNNIEKKRVNVVSNCLRLIKLPTYKPVQDNIVSHSINLGIILDNINALLREAYFQRIVPEERTKQQIQEAELKSIIRVLMQVAPANFDFRNLIESYSLLDSFLTNETNGNLGNDSETPSI